MNLKGRRRRRSPMKGMPRDRSGTRKTPAVTQRFASCKGNGDRFSVGWFWAPFSDHPCPTTTNPRTQGWNNVAALLAQATGDRQKKSSKPHLCASHRRRFSQPSQLEEGNIGRPTTDSGPRFCDGDNRDFLACNFLYLLLS